MVQHSVHVHIVYVQKVQYSYRVQMESYELIYGNNIICSQFASAWRKLIKVEQGPSYPKEKLITVMVIKV